MSSLKKERARHMIPFGIEALQGSHASRKFSYGWYKSSVLVLTFLCYMGEPAKDLRSALLHDTSGPVRIDN